jgi:hypothetical protein
MFFDRNYEVWSCEYWVVREAQLTSWFSILRTLIAQLSYKKFRLQP